MLLINGQTGVEYKPQIVFNENNASIDEVSVLQDRRRKDETALNRLKSLYLYGENELPEKDYIISRKKITDDIKAIDDRLAQLHSSSLISETDSDEFLQKASYFVMVEKLLSDRYVDYEKYIRNIEPNILRNFIISIVRCITVEDGKVKNITFKNGITHSFTYK